VDPSVFDRRDPLERLLDKNRSKVQDTKRVLQERLSQYDEDLDEGEAHLKKDRIDISRMSLNQFLNRYTSEDNHSFQSLHDKDRDEFIKRIGWMYQENERYTKLN